MKEARGREGITNYELRSANKKKHKATKMTPKRNKVFAEKKSIIAEAVAKKTLGWYKRLKYTTYTLRTLDSLTNKGVLGKFKRDRLYYFTTPKLLKFFITRAELYKR